MATILSGVCTLHGHESATLGTAGCCVLFIYCVLCSRVAVLAYHEQHTHTLLGDLATAFRRSPLTLQVSG
jgi:hypothetical protein